MNIIIYNNKNKNIFFCWKVTKNKHLNYKIVMILLIIVIITNNDYRW